MDLFIDTHLSDIVFILFYNNKIVKKQTIKGKEHSSILMPTLEEFLNDLVPKSILIVNGPGAFTSVRLGVTIAKTLAYTLNIPIRVISSLECLALSVNDSEAIVAFSDNNGYYVGEFNNMTLVNNYYYLSNNDFEEYQKNHKVLVNIKLDYEKILIYGLQKEKINPHKVNPIYIKKLDVEK